MESKYGGFRDNFLFEKWVIFSFAAVPPRASEAEFTSGSLAGLSPAPTDASWRCRRKWRNGSLGFVHWASSYGYEHRRHEGEQVMNISNCTTYVFVQKVSKSQLVNLADIPLHRGDASSEECDQQRCSVCRQRFADAEAFKLHLQAPALPSSTSSALSHQCQQCSRVFQSERALEQHTSSCATRTKGQKSQGKASHEHSGYGIHESGETDLVSPSFVVEVDGERLWHFVRQHVALRKYLPSKAAAKRAISSGELTLNGQHVEESRVLHPGDQVQLCLNKGREAYDAAAARAKLVRLVVLHYDGRILIGNSEISSTTAPWRVLRSLCPPAVAVVWKPSGMRSLGKHAGTLETSLPQLSEMPRHLQPCPLSRLEIGCSGVSLVALTDQMQLELKERLLSGEVFHVFRALVHGLAGSPGEIQRLDLRKTSEGSKMPEESDSSSGEIHTDVDESTPGLKEVHLRVVQILVRVRIRSVGCMVWRKIQVNKHFFLLGRFPPPFHTSTVEVFCAKVSIERGAGPEHTEHGGPLSIVELTTAAACGRLLNYCDSSVVVESTYTCLLDLISWQACAVESFWHQLQQVLWIPMPPHARVTPPCFLIFF